MRYNVAAVVQHARALLVYDANGVQRVVIGEFGDPGKVLWSTFGLPKVKPPYVKCQATFPGQLKYVPRVKRSQRMSRVIRPGLVKE